MSLYIYKVGNFFVKYVNIDNVKKPYINIVYFDLNDLYDFKMYL